MQCKFMYHELIYDILYAAQVCVWCIQKKKKTFKSGFYLACCTTNRLWMMKGTMNVNITFQGFLSGFRCRNQVEQYSSIQGPTSVLLSYLLSESVSEWWYWVINWFTYENYVLILIEALCVLYTTYMAAFTWNLCDNALNSQNVL